MKNFFWSRGLNAFITRTLTIVIVLLAINYMVKNTETSQTEQIESQQHPQATMNIKHEVRGNDLHLHVELSNFKLSLNNMDKKSEEGQGHIHLYVDDEKVTKIFEPQYVLKELEPGVHLIRLELAHNNHESYGVEETFSITIEE